MRHAFHVTAIFLIRFWRRRCHARCLCMGRDSSTFAYGGRLVQPEDSRVETSDVCKKHRAKEKLIELTDHGGCGEVVSLT